MSRILLMTEQYQSALACLQALGSRGHEIVVIAGSARSAHASSKYVTKIITPRVMVDTVEAKARGLKAIVEREKIDVVVPQSDDDALVVSLAKEMFPDVTAFVSATADSVRIACDKIRTLELAREIGVAVPESFIADEPKDLAVLSRGLGLPFVVKVPVATASSGTFMVKKPGDLVALSKRLPKGRLLVQQFIRGDRLGATGFARDGNLVGWFGFQVLPEAVAGGTPVYAVSDADYNLRSVLSTLCRRLNWNGGIDIDAMRAADGTIFLLEINPRFSGTLVFAEKLGVNLPACYLDAVEGRSSALAAQPPETTLFISYAHAEIGYISEDPRPRRKRAAELRAKYRYVENVYPDDGPLCLAQMKAGLERAWQATR